MYLPLVVLCVLFKRGDAVGYPYYDTQDIIYNVPKVYRVSLTLDRLLDYYERKPSKDPELYIALGIARGQLEYTMSQLTDSVPGKLRENLRNVTRRMDRVRSSADRASLLYRSKDHEYVAKSQLENLAVHAGLVRPLAVGTLTPAQPRRSTFEQYIKHASTKTPTRKTADECTMQLLLSAMESQRGGGAQDACELAPHCRAELVLGTALAFQMTSRLRAAQLANTFACADSDEFDSRVHKMCDQIYRETKSLEAWEHPAGTYTLFMQQIFYCSIQGYGEFIKPRWMNKIISWQRPSGCFADDRRPFQQLTGYTGAREREYTRQEVVQSAGLTCNSLASGMALGSLAVYVRALLDSGDS